VHTLTHDLPGIAAHSITEIHGIEMHSYEMLNRVRLGGEGESKILGVPVTPSVCLSCLSCLVVCLGWF